MSSVIELGAAVLPPVPAVLTAATPAPPVLRCRRLDGSTALWRFRR
ncbi:hypothetical protein GA0070607_0987 [Micromonospora coriariae]|uniref:Uncharacterized protein n=1 Tax=Micromonospora coriariae TaxID=285665 RepID=A0A1C4UQJ1_9ACTN|nr:hypothetical protein [Micromonospora coriariae]SCE73938.1 hypothetical protein GA0070607_0987 [Micromonospora coriariae]